MDFSLATEVCFLASAWKTGGRDMRQLAVRSELVSKYTASARCIPASIRWQGRVVTNVQLSANYYTQVVSWFAQARGRSGSCIAEAAFCYTCLARNSNELRVAR